MNKRILNISLFLMLASTSNVLAQQGIGTNTPHRSAALQIDSQNKGLLIPRVNITNENSSNPISGIAPEGLMVYNKGEGIGTIAKGFYYWYNGKWNTFLTSLNSSSTDDQVIENFEITSDHKLKIKIEGDSNTHQVDLAPYVNKSYAISSQVNEMILSVDGINITPAANIISNNTLSIENGTNNTKNLKSSVNSVVSSIDITNLIRTEQITYSLEHGTNTTAELVSNTANAKSYKVNVAPATTSTLGVVKIGSGFVATTDGTLNVNFPDPVADVNTSLSDLQTTGKLIGTYTNEANTSFQIKETVTSLSYVDNELIYTNEEGVQAGIPIVGEDTKTQLTNGNYTTVSLQPTESTFQNNTTNIYKVDVNVATKPENGVATYGVVKPGDGLSIAENGTLKVDFPTDNNTTYTAGTGITLTGTEFSVPVTTSSSSVANGNVITNVVQTANGIEITKATIATTDTKTKVEVTGPITVSQSPSVFTEDDVNTYTLGLNVGNGLSIENGTLNVTVVDTDTKSSVVSSLTTTVESPTLVNGVQEYKVEVNNLQGDVTGAIGSTKVEKIQGTPVSTTTPNVGQVLVATSIEEGTAVGWVPTTISATDTKTTVSGANGVVVTPTVNAQDTSSTDYKVVVKYAMPQVFYMPAMLFNAQAGQTYSNVDLYAHYVDQFATPFKSSAGASGMIPHVAAATQLEYYITYADPSILPDSITITADGKLTYSVGTGSQESFAYMTVVFVVKPNAEITTPTTTP